MAGLGATIITISGGEPMLMPLRASEWISVLAFSGFVALAWQRRLDRVRRVKITALGSAGIVATLFAALVLPGLAGPLSTSTTRDLLPCVLILLFYSLPGLFVTGANAGSRRGSFNSTSGWSRRR